MVAMPMATCHCQVFCAICCNYYYYGINRAHRNIEIFRYTTKRKVLNTAQRGNPSDSNAKIEEEAYKSSTFINVVYSVLCIFMDNLKWLKVYTHRLND